jgi:hypothetical protein
LTASAEVGTVPTRSKRISSAVSAKRTVIMLHRRVPGRDRSYRPAAGL